MSFAASFDDLPTLIAPRRAARWLLWSIILFTTGAIVWAGLATLPETANAPGRVVPSRQLQVISNLEGGVVTAILVHPGQQVRAGERLLQLDPAAAQADFGRSRAAANALAARIARLEAEVAGRAPAFPAALEAAAPAAVATERALWSARASDLGASSAGEAARLDGATRALGQAEAERSARSEARAQAAREVAMIAPLVEKGIEPRISLDRAQSSLAQAQSAETAANEAVRRSAAAVSEARAAVQGVAGRSRAQSGDALAAARAELAGQTASLPALRNRLDRADVRSPITGTVNRVLVSTIGGTVRPGDPLVEVVPGGDKLVVDARVKPSDIAFVHPGQKALVKLSAYDPSLYGALTGHVDRISPDAVSNDRTGESYFQVRVVTEATGLRTSDGSRLPVAAGMVADVSLQGHDRSILSYLLSPVTRLRDNAFREH